MVLQDVKITATFSAEGDAFEFPETTKYFYGTLPRETYKSKLIDYSDAETAKTAKVYNEVIKHPLIVKEMAEINPHQLIPM